MNSIHTQLKASQPIAAMIRTYKNNTIIGYYSSDTNQCYFDNKNQSDDWYDIFEILLIITYSYFFLTIALLIIICSIDIYKKYKKENNTNTQETTRNNQPNTELNTNNQQVEIVNNPINTSSNKV